jgi:MtN3 and saliva related transmembrane protein
VVLNNGEEKFMDTIQLTGYLAGFVIAVSLTPQVWKAWKTKSTRDISLLWNSIYIFGLLLFLVYGIGIREMPIIVMDLIETTLAVLLIVAKLVYK